MSGDITPLLTGGLSLLVGLEDDEDGSLRVYLGRRWTGIHTHVADEDAKRELRRVWGQGRGHALVTTPPREALCDCPNRPESERSEA